MASAELAGRLQESIQSRSILDWLLLTILILNSTTIQNETFANIPFMYLGFGLNTPLDYPSKGNYSPLTGDAIGEVLIRHSSGAIALIGNTRGVWYVNGDVTGSFLALARNRYFWENFTASGY